MRIALVLEDDYATRRAIAELLLRDGYGVCEGFQADPIPFVPAIDVIDWDSPHWHRLTDVPDNCSADGMQQVARVLTVWLQRVK